MAKKIRVTVWNEFRDQKESAEIAKIYPDGMHGAIAAGLRTDAQFAGAHRHARREGQRARAVGARRHRRAHLVGPHGPRGGQGRDRRPGAAAGARGHGPDRPALRPLLEDLQAHDGHQLRPAWREADEKTPVGGRTRAPHRRRPRRVLRARPTRRCTASGSTSPTPDEVVFISWFAGGEVFRSGCTFTAGKGRIFYFQPGHETYPELLRPERAARHRERRALGGPRRRPRDEARRLRAAPGEAVTWQRTSALGSSGSTRATPSSFPGACRPRTSMRP